MLSQQEVKLRFENKNLELISKYEKSCEKVKIKCYCNNIFYASPRDIFRGNTSSCGCYNKEKIAERFRKDIKGKKFGKLTAIKPIKSNKYQQMVWLFKCDCGNEKEIPLSWVTRKDKGIKSCGCLRHRPSIRWKGYGDISGTYWGSLQRNSKKSTSKRSKNIKFNISIKDAWDLFLKQNKKCALTGVELKFNRQYANNPNGKEQTASLDRIDSNKDYTLNNIQWVHKIVNKMKMNLNEKDFINWCKLIIATNNETS